MGHTKEATSRIDAMMANDPENARVLFYKAYMNWRSNDRQTMLVFGRRLQALGSPWSTVALSTYYAGVGDCDSGVQQFEMQQRAFGSSMSSQESETMYRGFCAGGPAREKAKSILAAHSTDVFNPAMWIQIGEPERAFDAFEHGGTGLSDAFLNWLWEPEDWSRKARSNAAFQSFAKRIGLVDYWKKYGWPDLCAPKPETGPDAFTCQ